MNRTLQIIRACILLFPLILIHVSFSYGAGISIILEDVIIIQTVGSTPLEFQDTNRNGISDDQEVQDDVDLDQNNISDNGQGDLKTFKTPSGNMLIGVKGASRVKGITMALSLEADKMEDQESKPDGLNEEMVCFQVECEKPGDTVLVTLLFETPIPENAAWIKYNGDDGWYDYSSSTEISEDRKSVTLELTDGGWGDADQEVNGFIIDPIGYAIPRESGSAVPEKTETPAVTVNTEESGDSSGSGGCFIRTAPDLRVP